MKRDATPRVEVRVTQRYGAPAERVFDAWIDPAIAGQWLFATASRPAERVTIDARAGGSFRITERSRGIDVVHAGEYVEITRPRRITFTLASRKGARDSSCVRVAIAPLDRGCELVLVQEKVLPDEASRLEGRWSGMLYGLGTLLSSTAPGKHR